MDNKAYELAKVVGRRREEAGAQAVLDEALDAARLDGANYEIDDSGLSHNQPLVLRLTYDDGSEAAFEITGAKMLPLKAFINPEKRKAAAAKQPEATPTA